MITLYFNDEALKAKELMNNIENYCNQMDDRLSVFKETSEISAINKMSGIKPIKVARDTFEILSKVNYKDIILNEKQKFVMLKKRGEQIELGGIAKGYIIDKIKEMIIENGFGNAIINLGGTVFSIGEKRNIGIRNPFTPMNQNSKQEIIMEVESKDEDIVTSGVYEQFIEKNGKIYHHIVSPYTGFPTDTEIISVTLIGKNGAELDSLATACLVLGLEKSNKLINRKKINAIFILNDGKIFYTKELKSVINRKGV